MLICMLANETNCVCDHLGIKMKLPNVDPGPCWTFGLKTFHQTATVYCLLLYLDKENKYRNYFVQ